MFKNEFALALLESIKDVLRYLGVKENILAQLDETIFLVIIIIIAFICGAIIRLLAVHFINRFLRYKKLVFFQSIMDNHAINKFSNLVPPLIISALLPFAFDNNSSFFIISEKLTWIYFLIFLIISTKAIGKAAVDALKHEEEWQNKPMKGFIEIIDIVLIFIIVLIIISLIINKTPMTLITGLGAFAAIILLIFKDTIVGFVSGVLVSENDMVHIGDWIEVPGTAVNGTVVDITLTIVKVLNFDNSIVTIPPNTLISSSLINWRPMQESGGRRIEISYNIKLDYIKRCTPEFLEKMKNFDPKLSDYIEKKQEQKKRGIEINTDNPDKLENGTIDTNLGLLRAYMTIYIEGNKNLNKNLTYMMRLMEPNSNGVPLQIYCFSANTNWVSFESIKSEVMEHFVSILTAFELYAYQDAGAEDIIIQGLLGSGKITLEDIKGIPWISMASKEKENV